MRQGLLALGGLAAVTTLTWALSPSDGHHSGAYHLAQLIGALALVGFATSFFIATRHRLLDGLFHGLDRAYAVHKWVGIGSLGLAVTHLVAIDQARGGQHRRGGPGGAGPGGAGPGGGDGPGPGLGDLGVPSLALFVVLVTTALVATKMKYEVWKTVHTFMVVPYLIGLVHYYGSSSFQPLGLTPLSLWMDLVTVVGLTSAVYAIALYEWTAFRFRYTVAAARTVARGTLEITGQAVGQPLAWRPGQFTFVTLGRGRARFPSHPFTISNAPGTDQIQLTIKASGDHTAALPTSLQVGDDLAVTAPHGRFDYTTGGPHQVWVAGGAGLAPFRSFYRAGLDPRFTVDLFYAYHGDAGAYLDELRALDQPNLRVHLVDDTVDGFLTVPMIEAAVDLSHPVDLYFCGPAPQRQALRRQLKTSRLQVRGFHFEQFGFGR